MDDMNGLKDMGVISPVQGWSADGVSTDTRKPVKGSLFFAIRGERFDGHDFTKDALAQGAAGIVIDKKSMARAAGFVKERPVFAVDDTVKSLGELAHIIRKRYRPVVIAITGSNGKTTTKDMLAGLLSGTYDTDKTQGNLNNLIGVPLSILNMKHGTKTWILELGTSRYGELARLTGITDPDIGILTNIGSAHLEFFHDLQGVAKAKSEMFSAMRDDGAAIVNADDPLAMGIAGKFKGRILTAGFSNDASLHILSYRLNSNGMEFDVSYKGAQHHLSMPLSGRHYLYDMSLAVLCSVYLGVSWNEIETACGQFNVFKGRGNIMQYENGITVVDDTYNANPDSMREGFLSAVERYGAGHIIAVIGDMLELGTHTAEQHHALGRFLAVHGICRFILVGASSEYTLQGILSAKAPGIHASRVAGINDAADELVKTGRSGDVIYVKGSRSMKMEQVISVYDSMLRKNHA